MTETDITPAERQRIWLYFLDLRLRYALVLLFLGLILVELRSGQVLLLAGSLWVGAVMVLAARRPSDQELDELQTRDLRSLVARALASLDPRPEVQGTPFAVFGPSAPARGGGGHRFIRLRTGADGLPRSPLNQALILVPREDRLVIHSCDHDSINGLTSRVSVEEHHYRDVVSVRLEEAVDLSTSRPRPAIEPDRGSAMQRTAQMLSLDLVNGRHLSVPAAWAWKGSERDEAAPQPTDLEKTVLAIQALMRDRR
jgi:hypothetical protein